MKIKMTASVNIYIYTILGCIGTILLVLLFWWLLYHQVMKRKNAPIHIRADTYFKSFALNATVISLAIAVTTVINGILQDKKEEWETDNNITAIITITVAFVATFSSYFIMYILTGYGHGMFA